MNYRIDGPEGAPALVLSNSLGTDLDLWSRNLEHWIERPTKLRYEGPANAGTVRAPTTSTIHTQPVRDTTRLWRTVLGVGDRGGSPCSG